MNTTNAVWSLVLLAAISANLPFLNNRWMGLLPRRTLAAKGLHIRLLELIAAYFIVGGVGLYVEQSISQIYPQGWELYAVTGFLFVTLAFPGFVYRYLMRH